MNKENYPKYPLYIVSKGRHEYMITSKALTKMGINHFIVVEPQEVDLYQASINKMKLLTTVVPLDMSYKEKYELCDNLGLTKSTGSGPARNYAWDHSIKNGHEFHWVMDDNILWFKRLWNNQKIMCNSPAFFRAMESFVEKYLNVAMAGPEYHFFAVRKAKLKPFAVNVRVFSCNLIRNNIPFRWRGRYNEDIILSLDILKSGWCTILFKAFLQGKMQTQQLKGGNTDELYHGGSDDKDKAKYSKTGTIDKSKMLVRVHGDVAKLKYKYGRVHHEVDIKNFKRNKLILNPKWNPPTDPEFGMRLKLNG